MIIELTSAVALLVSSLYGPVSAVAQDVSNSSNTQSQTAIENPITLPDYVKAYFAETPILAKVAKCESTYRQVGSDGKVLRGKVNSDDVGLMQINEHYHGEKAKSMGLDLETIEGNLAYAKYLYEKEGTAPWSASAKCWNK
jgi:hypothetical protein